MSDTAVLAGTAVAIVAIVVLIVRFRVNPVISLVLGSLCLGLMTPSAWAGPSRRSPRASATSWPRSGF
ncbi:hypothetical protein ACFQX6_48680 [Streptosporangium lutulentum]